MYCISELLNIWRLTVFPHYSKLCHWVLGRLFPGPPFWWVSTFRRLMASKAFCRSSRWRWQDSWRLLASSRVLLSNLDNRAVSASAITYNNYKFNINAYFTSKQFVSDYYTTKENWKEAICWESTSKNLYIKSKYRYEILWISEYMTNVNVYIVCILSEPPCSTIPEVPHLRM